MDALNGHCLRARGWRQKAPPNSGRMAQLLPAERELSPRVNRDASRVSHAADAEIVVVGSSGDDDLHLVGALEIFLPIGPLN
jgi:hypothetical protein